jgi:uncharacterized membrane protein YjgN (DUF898 family)
MAHGEFTFKGTGGSYFWLVIWTTLLTMFTAGLLWPVAYAAQERWVAKNTYIDGHQLVFKGSALGVFVLWLKILFLTLITIGIYAPWGWCAVKRWQVNNLYFADTGDVERV